MKVRSAIVCAAVAASLGLTGWAYGTEFTAFNDCQSGGAVNPANTTLYGWTTTANQAGFTSGGALKDYVSGSTLTASVAITGNLVNTAGDGAVAEFTGGSDAANIFGGNVVNTGKVIYYNTAAGWYVDMVFSGLTPGAEYSFATTLDRGTGGTIPAPGYYTDRWTVITLSDIDGSTYASSSGAFQVSPTATCIQSYNTINGYVAKWTNISPGADGDFAVRFTYATDVSQYPNGASQNGTRGYGPAMFLLQETPVPEPASLALLALAGLPLLARRRRV